MLFTKHKIEKLKAFREKHADAIIELLFNSQYDADTLVDEWRSKSLLYQDYVSCLDDDMVTFLENIDVDMIDLDVIKYLMDDAHTIDRCRTCLNVILDKDIKWVTDYPDTKEIATGYYCEHCDKDYEV